MRHWQKYYVTEANVDSRSTTPIRSTSQHHRSSRSLTGRPSTPDMSSSRPQTPHSPRPSARAIPRAPTPDRPRNPVKDQLRSIHQETESVLPGILKKLKNGSDVSKFEKYTLIDLPRLSPNDCPSFPTPATITVINKDTFDTAIAMMADAKSASSSSSSSTQTPAAGLKPAVVNFANRHEPGGGWRNGAMAQEEALFYRSSLSLSLQKQRVPYPLGTNDAVYSPHVVVIRSSFADGHQLLSPSNPEDELPVMSVLTVAAINRPETESYTVQSRLPKKDATADATTTTATTATATTTSPDPAPAPAPALPPAAESSSSDTSSDIEMEGTAESESTSSESEMGNTTSGKDSASTPAPSSTPATSKSKGLPPTKRIFKYNRERNLTKDKMRLVLRMAASKGHTSIVLGALGCGAFENPPEDVAHCWLEVLREDEFSGNWWKDVVFAVFDSNDTQDGNFNIFRTILHGKEV